MIKFENILFIGVFYRLIIFFLVVIFPFEHSLFGSISPISFQEFSDLRFYLRFGEKEFQVNNFFSNYHSLITLNISNIDNRFPGPLFPIILFITQYSKEFTYLLAIVIFISEISAYLIWSYKKFKINNLYPLIFFSLMPIPLYFGFVHSTDIIFYLIFTCLYFEIKDKPKKNTVFLLFFLILICRPNSAIIFLCCIFYFFFIKQIRYFVILSLIFFLLSIFYYGPYFFYEMTILKKNYNNFILYDISDILSLTTDYIKKVIFLLGFVPSSSGNTLFYILRSLCGIVFCIGIINLFRKKNIKIDKLFVGFFVFLTALLFFPAYRYILPITPILIYYFSDLPFVKTYKN
jgi:hypothetical protein